MWRRIAVLQVCCIASSFALDQSSSSTSRLTPRKSVSNSYDPWIICDLEGPTHAEGLPPQYSHQVYSELLTLCSFAHGARQNVGCFCSRPTGNVHCDRHLADQGLWQARYSPEDEYIIHHFEVAGIFWGEMSFPDLCRHGCECRTPENARTWFNQNFGGADYDALVGVNGLVPQQDPSSEQPGSGGGGGGRGGGGAGTTFGAGTVEAGVHQQQQPGNHHHEIQWQNQCGNNCTSAKDCGVPEGGGNSSSSSSCTCQAHSSQYQPGSGAVTFIAACLVSLASGGDGGGKRGEEEGLLPCPCNSTYVSHTCCGVLDGLVWEPVESNLGKLVDGV